MNHNKAFIYKYAQRLQSSGLTSYYDFLVQSQMVKLQTNIPFRSTHSMDYYINGLDNISIFSCLLFEDHLTTPTLA